MEYQVTITKEDIAEAEKRELSIMNGTKAQREKEYKPVEKLDDLPLEIQKRIKKRIEHRLTYKWFQKEYGMPEAANKFKVAWHKAPSPYHDLLAQKHYGKRYMELSCQDRKATIREFIENNEKKVIDEAVADIKLEPIKLSVEVKESINKIGN